jgi:hypothetical protein
MLKFLNYFKNFKTIQIIYFKNTITIIYFFCIFTIIIELCQINGTIS